MGSDGQALVRVEMTASKEICEGRQELFIYPGEEAARLSCTAQVYRRLSLWSPYKFIPPTPFPRNSHADRTLGLFRLNPLRKDGMHQKSENAVIPCWIVGSIGVNGVIGADCVTSTFCWECTHMVSKLYTSVRIHHTHSADTIESTCRTHHTHATHGG